MVIDKELMNYLQELSRLELSAEELEEAGEELSKILGYMSKLEELDTGDAPELSHPFGNTNCLREDVVTPSFDREKILANAPGSSGEYFRAPKTVE
ncbi:Asp-tRNA(Asn)/Glu-tRNA(Gln) amidotransferase subunit GatC [Oscillospiraceae bacterium MB08-C2-2]|nr:Asp-tRNA(Asn)/Glu-tRNA(Gln) amidotransferase subunit GatC [Oscillospiraceae bacterium MB08-C2-2]